MNTDVVKMKKNLYRGKIIDRILTINGGRLEISIIFVCHKKYD